VTFTDTAYNSAGTAEVLTGGYPQFADSQSIIDFTRSGSTSTSSYVDAKPGINNNSALHTVAVYPLNFAGTLTIEGTMSTEPEVTSTPQNQYFTISTNIIDTSDTIKYYNFNGILRLVPTQLPPQTLSHITTSQAYYNTFGSDGRTTVVIPA
jgi:hypothetical protein